MTFPGTKAQHMKVLENSIYSYGFLSVLKLLEVLTNKEEYEHCQTIIEVLKLVSKKIGYDLPTRFCQESIEIYQETIIELGGNSRCDPETQAVEYALKIIDKLKKLK